MLVLQDLLRPNDSIIRSPLQTSAVSPDLFQFMILLHNLSHKRVSLPQIKYS